MYSPNTNLLIKIRFTYRLIDQNVKHKNGHDQISESF